MHRLWLTVTALVLCIVGGHCYKPLKYKVHDADRPVDPQVRDIYPFQNVSLDWKTRVDDLVSRLTVDEVIAQLSYGGAGGNGPAPAIKRLGIPPFQWNNECLRGYVEAGPATSFPDAINLASTFDKSIVYRVAEAGASEARAKHAEYVKQGQYGDHTGLDCFSPVINIMAHPLWGRSHETYGEDPSLTAQLAESFVHGLMGNDSRYIRANSICKHYAAYNGPENIPTYRYQFDAVVPEVDMRMTFLPQFEACIKAGAQGVMCSYNSVNGIPACAHNWLLTQVLRKEWNFTGFVVSDEGAIQMSMTQHHYFSSAIQTAVGTIQSGVNLELSWSDSPPIWTALTQAVQQGLIDKALLYERVWPLFYTRMRLGDFDPDDMNPYTKYNLSLIQGPAHKNLSLLAAKKSLVLLKLTGNLLPIRKTLPTLTLIGPFSNTTDQFFGDYSPTPDIKNTTNVVEGLRMLVSHPENVTMVPGCADTSCKNYDDSQRTLVLSAIKNERNLIVLALGTGQLNEMESNDRSTFELPGKQPAMIADVLAAAEAASLPVVLLLFTASPANITRAISSPAVVAVFQCAFPAQETGLAIFHVLSLADDDSNPAGRLPYSWPHDESQLPSMVSYDMRNKTYRFRTPTTKPLFGFGFGLSYSTFQYSFTNSRPLSLLVHRPQPHAQYENRTFNVTVKNLGPFNGDAVLQVYVRWPDQVYTDKSFERVPGLQMLAFERVSVKAGETRVVPVVIDTKWLRLWTIDQFVIPSGSYTLFVDGSQPDTTHVSKSGDRFSMYVFSSDDMGQTDIQSENPFASILVRGAPMH